MPKYFPLPPKTIEVETTDVDNTEDLNFEGETTTQVIVEDDYYDFDDAISDTTLITEDDDFDAADQMEFSGDVDAEENLLTNDSDMRKTLLVPDPLIIVSEPPSLNPDAADFYHLYPRIADSISDLGAVIDYDASRCTGVLEMDGENSSAQFGQIREASPDTSFAIVTVDGSANEEIRANQNTVGNGNALMVVCGWDLTATDGIRWTDAGISSAKFIFCQVENPSGLSSRNINFMAKFVSNLDKDIDVAPTWNNCATLRGYLGGTDLSDELNFEESISPGSNTAPFVTSADFSAPASSSTNDNLWCVLWQDATVLNAGVVAMFADWTVELEFQNKF